MECRTCSEALTGLMDDELSVAERQLVEEHLDRCSTCSAEYDSLLFAYETMDRYVHRLEDRLQLDPNGWSRIESQILEPRVLEQSRPGLLSRLRAFVDATRAAFTTKWIPVALTVGLLVGLALPILWPEQDPLEAEFMTYVENREAMEQAHQRILTVSRPPSWNSLHPNPFIARQIQGNPFSSE